MIFSNSLVNQNEIVRDKFPRVEHPIKRRDSDLSSLGIRGRSTGKLSLNQRQNSNKSRNTKFSQIDENLQSESPRTRRILVDELEIWLREELRLNFNEIRKKFVQRSISNSDFNSIKVSRISFEQILHSILIKRNSLSNIEIEELIQRLELDQFDDISFNQFVDSLVLKRDKFDRSIIETHQDHRQQEKTNKKLTAEQVFLILKEKFQSNDYQINEILPGFIDGPQTRIFKAQLKNSLEKCSLTINDQEFDKLWEKFDTDGFKAVQSDKFKKILGLNSNKIDEQTNQYQQTKIDQSRRTSISSNKEKLDENNFLVKLNEKFPQGFSQLENKFDKLDTKQTGLLPKKDFIEILSKFGFEIDQSLINYLLNLLEIDLTLTNGLLPYRDIINIFKQDKDKTKKRLNVENKLNKSEPRQVSLERQIDYSISMNYKKVKSKFHRFDPENKGIIDGNQFRLILEDLLNYSLKADEFYQLTRKIDKDEQGFILYNVYLKGVLDRSISLQQEENRKFKKSDWTLIDSTQHPANFKQEQIKSKLQNEKENLDDKIPFESNSIRCRSFEQLRSILKYFIENQSKQLENQFKLIDRSSYGELNKNYLYRLLNNLSIEPKINDQEIELIWSNSILKENGNLDFHQFLRQFGHSKGSAHFPNAKTNPPKRGDADFLLTSRKLYGDSVLIEGNLLNSIRSNWNQLKDSFIELDPHRTGFIQPEEFDEIVYDLCPSVNQEDLNIFKEKYRKRNDLRLNYLNFLKDYSPKLSRTKNKEEMILPSIDEDSIRSSSNNSHSNPLNKNLQRKLNDRYKQIRRSFKSKDKLNNGIITIEQFKSVLDEHQCHLDQEEFYTILSRIDTNFNGTINYNYFLKNFVKST